MYYTIPGNFTKEELIINSRWLVQSAKKIRLKIECALFVILLALPMDIPTQQVAVDLIFT